MSVTHLFRPSTLMRAASAVVMPPISPSPPTTQGLHRTRSGRSSAFRCLRCYRTERRKSYLCSIRSCMTAPQKQTQGSTVFPTCSTQIPPLSPCRVHAWHCLGAPSTLLDPLRAVGAVQTGAAVGAEVVAGLYVDHRVSTHRALLFPVC